MLNEIEQKNLLEQNWKPLEIFAKAIADTIDNCVAYQVGDYCGSMGCKLLNNNRYLVKSDIKGIYVVFLKFKEHFIVLYVGESDKSLGTRIGRLIKQAAGENRDDEAHSAGQLLYDKFTIYGRDDVWRNNLYVKFISLTNLKKVLGDTAYAHSDLFGEKYYKVAKLDNKIILKHFESKMIDNFGPISNKMSQSFKNTNLHSENVKQFNILCNSIEKKVDDGIKLKPWFESSIAKLSIAWYY